MFLNFDNPVTNKLGINTPISTDLTTENVLKLVIVGNVGSGKTTSIKVISEKEMISTEAKATERDALHRKEQTTVAMEYGVLHLQDTKLHIYGTPGQRRFDFMADIICKGAEGMLIMIDNGHSEPLKELDYFLDFHKNLLKNKPAIIAVTHYDDNNTNTNLIEYHQHLRDQGFKIPVMRLDAREKGQVTSVIQKLLNEIIARKTLSLH